MKRQLIPRFLIIALVMLAMMGALIFQLGVLIVPTVVNLLREIHIFI